MKSMIEELWYGEACPQEERLFQGAKFAEVSGQIMQKEKELRKSMTQEQKQLYEAFMDSRCDFYSLTEPAIFACGFRYGARMMLEILTDEQISPT